MAKKPKYSLVYNNTTDCNIVPITVPVLEPVCDISSSDLTATQYSTGSVVVE